MQTDTQTLIDQFENFAGIWRPLSEKSLPPFEQVVTIDSSGCCLDGFLTKIKGDWLVQWMPNDGESGGCLLDNFPESTRWLDPSPETKAAILFLLQQKKDIEVSDEWACDIYKESIGYDSYDTTGIFLAGCTHVHSQLSAASFTKEDMMAAFRQGIDIESGDSNIAFDRWLPKYADERNISLSAKDKNFKTEKEFWDWFNQQPPGSVNGSVIWSAAKDIYENEKDELLSEMAKMLSVCNVMAKADNATQAERKIGRLLTRYNSLTSPKP